MGFLHIAVESRRFCLDLSTIGEILPMLSLSTPRDRLGNVRAGAAFCGFATIDFAPIPVFDAAGLPRPPVAERYVLVMAGDQAELGPFGLIVDEVLDVLDSSEVQIIERSLGAGTKMELVEFKGVTIPVVDALSLLA